MYVDVRIRLAWIVRGYMLKHTQKKERENSYQIIRVDLQIFPQASTFSLIHYLEMKQI